MDNLNYGHEIFAQLEKLQESPGNPKLLRGLFGMLDKQLAQRVNGFDFTKKPLIMSPLEDILANTVETSQMSMASYESLVLDYVAYVKDLVLTNGHRTRKKDRGSDLNEGIRDVSRSLERCERFTVAGVTFLRATQPDKEILIGDKIDFFPSLDETLADPEIARRVCLWYEDAVNRLKERAQIDGICVVEKPYSTIGGVSLIAYLAMQCTLPITVYRKPRWNRQLRIEGKIPQPDTRLVVVYDVSISGSGIEETADFIREEYGAYINHAVVLFDFDISGSAQTNLAPQGIELQAFLKESNLPGSQSRHTTLQERQRHAMINSYSVNTPENPKNPEQPDLDILDRLESWLVAESIPYKRALFATESIRSFLTHHILQRRTYIQEIGITGQRGEAGHNHVWLHFLMPQPFDSLEQSVRVNELNKLFTHSVAIPILPNLAVHTEFFTHEDVIDVSFEELLLGNSQKDNLIYFGRIKSEEDYLNPSVAI